MTEDDLLPRPEGPTAPEPVRPTRTRRDLPGATAPTRDGDLATPSRFRSDRLGSAALALLLFAASLAWFSLSLDRTFHLTDEGYLLRMGQRVAAGESTHRDFVEDYGPGVFFAIGLLWRAGGEEILFVREAIAVWKALAVVLAFMLTRRAAPTAVAFGAGLLSIVYWGRASLNVNAPHAALMTVPLCMASAHLLAVAMQTQAAGDRDAAYERRRRWLIALAGFAGGLAVLFKQSLGVMNAYGLGLALVAVALCGLDPAARRSADGSAPRARGETALLLAAFALLAGGLLVPGLRYLTGLEYAVHFLPLHALMACVAVAALRRRDGVAIWPLAAHRLLPLALGAAVPLGLVAACYAATGHLDDLLGGMFERPLRRRNYAIATFLPPPSLSLFVTGAALCAAGACLLLGRRTRLAAAGVTCGVICMLVAAACVPHSNPDLYTPGVLLQAASAFDWVGHTIVLCAAAAVFGPRLVEFAAGPGASEAMRRHLAAVLPVAFFSGLLCFQIYPRGAHNVWLVQAAWMPLLAITLHAAWRSGLRGASPAGRKGAAMVLVLACLWLAWPVAAGAWKLHAAPHRPLALPHARGLDVGLESVEQWRLGDVEALVAELRRRPPGPLLLIGGDAMLYVLSDRPALRPEHEYALQNVVLDMLPLRELAALDDGGWVAALERQPTAAVVVVRDPAGRRVLAALPSVETHLDRHFEPTRRFGRYQLYERVSSGGAVADDADLRAPR